MGHFQERGYIGRPIKDLHLSEVERLAQIQRLFDRCSERVLANYQSLNIQLWYENNDSRFTIYQIGAENRGIPLAIVLITMRVFFIYHINFGN